MDAEEVVLFPGLPAQADEVPGDALSASEAGEALGKLRVWIGAQLVMAEDQLRKHKDPAKPEGITPAIAAYLQAREAKAGFKAAREAYMKATQKADHYVKKAGE